MPSVNSRPFARASKRSPRRKNFLEYGANQMKFVTRSIPQDHVLQDRDRNHEKPRTRYFGTKRNWRPPTAEPSGPGLGARGRTAGQAGQHFLVRWLGPRTSVPVGRGDEEWRFAQIKRRKGSALVSASLESQRCRASGAIHIHL